MRNGENAESSFWGIILDESVNNRKNHGVMCSQTTASLHSEVNGRSCVYIIWLLQITGDFAADVMSSNTVGYTKIDLNKGYSCIAPAFYTVGEDTIDISAMEVVDGADTDSISLLNSTGNTVAQYFWFNAFGEWPAMWALDGQGAQEATGVSFDQMEGFLLYSNNSAAKFKHFGEVLEDDVEAVALNKGYTTLGNPYNKALPLENLVPVNAADTDSISLLNSTGNVVAQYFWFNAFGEWPAMWALDGQGSTEATGVTLDPDEAFLFYSNNSAATLDVTAP